MRAMAPGPPGPQRPRDQHHFRVRSPRPPHAPDEGLPVVIASGLFGDPPPTKGAHLARLAALRRRTRGTFQEDGAPPSVRARLFGAGGRAPAGPPTSGRGSPPQGPHSLMVEQGRGKGPRVHHAPVGGSHQMPRPPSPAPGLRDAWVTASLPHPVTEPTTRRPAATALAPFSLEGRPLSLTGVRCFRPRASSSSKAGATRRKSLCPPGRARQRFGWWCPFETPIPNPATTAVPRPSCPP